MKLKLYVLAALALLGGTAAAQDIQVGVTLSATGPAASLGIPERNTIALLPKTIAGYKIDKADVVVGPAVTPNSPATIDVAAETETPTIATTASSRIVESMDAKP